MKMNDDEKHRKPLTIRLSDFHATNADLDPTSTMASAFAITSKTTLITPTTPAARNRGHAALYSDAKE